MRLDLALAAALSVLAVITAIVDGDGGAETAVLLLSSLLMTAPLAWRRVHPTGVLLVSMGALAGAAVLTEAPETPPTLFATVIAVYSAAAHTPLRTAVAGAIVASAAITVAIVTDSSDSLGNVPPTLMLFVIAPFAAGAIARSRDETAAELRERAAALEVEREETQREAAAQERARIARELHDVVSHGMSMIAVQADAAEAALETRPELAGRPVAAVKHAARESLADMRRMLGLLRETERDAAVSAHGVDDLPALIDRVNAAGVVVKLTVTGEPRPLAPEVGLTAYRVVQEALTNTVKHKRGAHAEVAVEYGADGVTVAVVDAGPARQSEEAGGDGLTGMRDRVELLGGRLLAEHRPSGAFEVRAVLPEATPA
jgi:signal transduction histidine kinase